MSISTLGYSLIRSFGISINTLGYRGLVLRDSEVKPRQSSTEPCFMSLHTFILVPFFFFYRSTRSLHQPRARPYGAWPGSGCRRRSPRHPAHRLTLTMPPAFPGAMSPHTCRRACSFSLVCVPTCLPHADWWRLRSNGHAWLPSPGQGATLGRRGAARNALFARNVRGGAGERRAGPAVVLGHARRPLPRARGEERVAVPDGKFVLSTLIAPLRTSTGGRERRWGERGSGGIVGVASSAGCCLGVLWSRVRIGWYTIRTRKKHKEN